MNTIICRNCLEPVEIPQGADLERQLAEASAPAVEQQIKLDDIEQYRCQMAGISTAALGYWKEGDSIHPDYDTIALRDVAKLYAKYDALYKAAEAARQPAPVVAVKTWQERVAEKPYPEADSAMRQIQRNDAMLDEITDLRAALAATNRSHPPVKLKEVIENLYSDNLNNLLGDKP